MTDLVKQMAWDIYADAVRRWRLDRERTPKPRVAFQIGHHIASLPVEANRTGTNLPAEIGPASWISCDV
jgi:hypothetical protein